jgi:hypothetical protein
MADDAIRRLTPEQSAQVTFGYREATFGRDEPDVAWCNGKLVLDIRKNFGDIDINDSEGNPIREGACYILIRGEVHLWTE